MLCNCEEKGVVSFSSVQIFNPLTTVGTYLSHENLLLN